MPCRISIFVEGMEWFLYNRTPTYDELLSKMGLPKTSDIFHDRAQDAEAEKDGIRWRRRRGDGALASAYVDNSLDC